MLRIQLRVLCTLGKHSTNQATIQLQEEKSHINQDDKPQRTERWLRTLKTTQFEAVQLLLKSWIVFIYLEVIKLSIFFKCTKGAGEVGHWLRVLAAPAGTGIWVLEPTGGSPCNSRGSKTFPLHGHLNKRTYTHTVFKMYTGLYSVCFFFNSATCPLDKHCESLSQ